MARRHSNINPNLPYSIGSRCINRDWFHQPLNEVWQCFEDHLYFAKHAFDLRIHSFVLMQNHFHMIARAPQGNLSEAMGYFLRQVSRDLTKSSDRINGTWGNRFFRTALTEYHHYMCAYKYIYRNPVEANACTFVEEYPYSTLNGLLGFSKLIIPVENDTVLFDHKIEQSLLWLNSKSQKSDWESIRKALRRQEFKLPKENGEINPLQRPDHTFYKI
jgi:REP element-mobilizing transposase RayT